MINKLLSLCAMSLITAIAWGQSPTIKVEGGLVQGVTSASSEVTVFRGIPYAAPPVGKPGHVDWYTFTLANPYVMTFNIK